LVYLFSSLKNRIYIVCDTKVLQKNYIASDIFIFFHVFCLGQLFGVIAGDGHAAFPNRRNYLSE